jgi:hypothetical protein
MRPIFRVGCAVSVIAIGFAVAVTVAVSRTRLPALATSPVLGKLMVGAVAVAVSLPLVGLPLLVASRPTMRTSWRNADSATRRAFVVHLVGRGVAALVVWGVFLLVILRS